MDNAELHQALWRLMRRFGRLNMAHVFGDAAKGQPVILQMLLQHRAEQPDSPGMYVYHVVEQMGASPPAISRMLRAMEAGGLIRRSVDSENRRNTFIHLTDKGVREVAVWQTRMECMAGSLAQQMGEEDMKTLFRLWGRLLDIMENERPLLGKGETKC